MHWRQRYNYVRPTRPKARSLPADEAAQILAKLAAAIDCSPEIVEVSGDRARVLVRFTAVSWSGGSFGGTCLYLNRDEHWRACTIRPNQSQSIATAEAWLVKRNWKSWG